MAAKAEQANEHHDEQGEVRYKRSDIGHFGDLDVERGTWNTGGIPCSVDLLKAYMSAARQRH